MLISILSGQGKQKKAAAVPVDIPSVINEIHYFIKCAHASLYIAPNKVILKSERPKWRFKVKNYLKILHEISEDDPYYADAVEVFILLYEMLCEGCGTYLFNTDDPFRSIGRSQPELYEEVLLKMIPLGISDEVITKMILMAANLDVSTETLHIELYLVLLSILGQKNQRESIRRNAKALLVKQ